VLRSRSVSDEVASPIGPALPRCPHCGEDHPSQVLKCPDTDLALPLEGRLLHGKFRFLRQLGRGGMAAVWLALNTGVERRVAIKLIRPEAGRSDETIARFRAEAKAAGRIGHPNVCEILDFGLGPLGPYIVMERLRGRSLGQLVRDEERLPPELAAAIIRQALAGLEAAHRRGIIHRDLKPENLFIHQPEVGPPVVKIMDFGVSKFTDGTSEVETGHGALLGTPEYMSPEQFRGAARADARTDVWAMGAILYKVLTGKTAFGGASVPGTLLMVTSDEPAPIPELVRGVPPELVAVVEKCLRKDPDERFQSAQELSDALEPFDLDGLASLGLVEAVDPSEEMPAPPTVSVSGRASAPPGSRVPPSPPASDGTDTLLPSTGHRLAIEEPRRPARPERRAWLLIAGVTIVGVAVLVALTRDTSQREDQPIASAKPPIEARTSAGAAASEGSDRGEPATTDGIGTAGPTTSGITGAVEPPLVETAGTAEPTTSDTTGAAEPPQDTDGGTTGDATDGDPVVGDEPTTGIPEGPEDGDDEGADDGVTGGNNGRPTLDPERPLPTPPGTVRAGSYIALVKPGPSSDHADARAYCRNLGKQSFLGVKTWNLAGPQGARRFASLVKRGKYWTTALWKGKALVLSLPSKTKSSLAADKKGPRPLCLAKWP
jgi:serine/threonine protein kinase